MINDYHRTVKELTRDELIELKADYYTAMIMETEHRAPSYDEMVDIDNLVDDAFIMNHYSHLTFVDEDFFCNCENKC